MVEVKDCQGVDEAFLFVAVLIDHAKGHAREVSLNVVHTKYPALGLSLIMDENDKQMESTEVMKEPENRKLKYFMKHLLEIDSKIGLCTLIVH